MDMEYGWYLNVMAVDWSTAFSKFEKNFYFYLILGRGLTEEIRATKAEDSPRMVPK
jgi:hypothetical protein